jgi:hypothetical protein
MEGAIDLVYQNMAVLAEKAGIPWQQFWAERVQATYVQSVTSLVIQGVLVFIGILLVAFLLSYAKKADKSSDEFTTACVVMGVDAVILFLMLVFILSPAVMGFSNPEYQALSDIYGKAVSIAAIR